MVQSPKAYANRFLYTNPTIRQNYVYHKKKLIDIIPDFLNMIGLFSLVHVFQPIIKPSFRQTVTIWMAPFRLQEPLSLFFSEPVPAFTEPGRPLRRW